MNCKGGQELEDYKPLRYIKSRNPRINYKKIYTPMQTNDYSTMEEM